MNPWLILAIVVGWGLSMAGAFHFGTEYESGQEAKREKLIEDVRTTIRSMNQSFSDDLGKRVEDRLAKIRITNQTFNNEIRTEREVHREVLENPDCYLPASTLRLLNRARGFDGEGGPGTGKPADRMPAAGTPSGENQPRGSGR